MRKLTQIWLLTLVLLLGWGCSVPTNWAVRDARAPAQISSTELDWVALGDRWIVIRASWFGQQMGLSSGQIHDTLGGLLQNALFEQVSQLLPIKKTLNADLYETWAPPESFKFDSTIFAKLRLPAQGQKLDSTGNLILVMHELTMGPDIDAYFFYDHTQNGEIAKTKVQNLSALAHWTLWDNRTQSNLITAVAQAQLPWANTAELAPQIHNLISLLTQKIHCQLEHRCDI